MMDRQTLIELVKKIQLAEGTEEEQDKNLELLEKNVLDPEISDYIFYTSLTAEQIVDKALAYKPLQL